MSNVPQVMVSRFYVQIAKVTLLTSIIWTIVAVNAALQKDYPSEVDENIIAPLTPTMDEEVLERLTRREQMNSALENYVPKDSSITTTK